MTLIAIRMPCTLPQRAVPAAGWGRAATAFFIPGTRRPSAGPRPCPRYIERCKSSVLRGAGVARPAGQPWTRPYCARTASAVASPTDAARQRAHGFRPARRRWTGSSGADDDRCRFAASWPLSMGSASVKCSVSGVCLQQVRKSASEQLVSQACAIAVNCASPFCTMSISACLTRGSAGGAARAILAGAAAPGSSSDRFPAFTSAIFGLRGSQLDPPPRELFRTSRRA
mmetsp:Transcript_12261/g.28636  ORF Transcript_12261/g.28636 Transcript_12261/m.28636 type:complete len:228 (+) Transcript_12261:494-1177(+)